MKTEDFRRKFDFQESGSLFIGVERERHIVDKDGVIVPTAAKVLEALENGHFGYELSACQIEDKTDPIRLENLEEALLQNDETLGQVLRELSLGTSHQEVAPADMPLDVYPDPTGRYQRIVENMPIETLRAACRVIGTHIHVGMPDHETALRVYNQVINYTDSLVSIGDGSDGERMRIYRQMAPDATPPYYRDWDDFYSVACAKGFDQDPRKCWTLIRISVHGTIEFRMFGTTPVLKVIVCWARHCFNLCEKALKLVVV